jgi:flagellar motility protein MotE (MotC chaperone)
MKNFLILGLLALLLFSVSAALSLWLNQSKQQADADKTKDDKATPKAPKDAPPKEGTEPRPPGGKSPEGPSGSPETTARDIRDQQDKLVRRAAQIEVVVRDLQTQREATEATLRQVMSELKNVSTETTKLDALANDLKQKMIGFEAGEKKNIEKIAAMYDAMTPEAAGPILKQMADTGRIEMAAKILAQMKERKAATVLEAMNDPALALAILEKMRGLRAAVPPAPAPVVPAKGP